MYKLSYITAPRQIRILNYFILPLQTKQTLLTFQQYRIIWKCGRRKLLKLPDEGRICGASEDATNLHFSFRPLQMRCLIRRWRVTIGDRGSLLRICIRKRVYWNARNTPAWCSTGNQTIFFEKGTRARVRIRCQFRPGHIKHHVTFCGKRMVYYASFYGVIQLGDLTRRHNALAYSRLLEISSRGIFLHFFAPHLNPFYIFIL